MSTDHFDQAADAMHELVEAAEARARSMEELVQSLDESTSYVERDALVHVTEILAEVGRHLRLQGARHRAARDTVYPLG